MPMMDVYAPADLFPADADRALGEQLTRAVLRAEGVPNPGPFHADNTAAYIHRLPGSAVQTHATAQSRTVRVQVITPPGALSRDGQRQLVNEATGSSRRSRATRRRPRAPGWSSPRRPKAAGACWVRRSARRNSPRSPRRPGSRSEPWRALR